MSMGTNGLPGHWNVLLYRISWGEGMLCSLDGPNLMFDEAIRPWEEGARGDVIYIVALQELSILTRMKGGIIGVDKAGWSLLGDEFLHMLG